MPLTLEERERIAYIEGRTEEAALLQLAVESEGIVQQDLADRAEELKDAEDEIGKLTSELDDVRVRIIDLEEQLENVQDEAKELRQQIHEASIDLL